MHITRSQTANDTLPWTSDNMWVGIQVSEPLQHHHITPQA